MSKRLVLWKPRPQRLAESIILPILILPVGPILRALLGDDYRVDYGLVAWLPLMLLVTFVGRQWALRHGGEWVGAAERLQRLLEEFATQPRWHTALSKAAMYALLLCAAVVTIEPISNFGEGFGGPLVTLGGIGLLAVSAAIPALTGSYQRLASVTVDQREGPPRQLLSETVRLLPRSYLATLVSTLGGVLVGRQLNGDLRAVGFLITTIVIFQALHQLPYFRKLPKRFYPTSRFAVFLLYGLVGWGIPFAIISSGFAALLAADRPTFLARGIGLAISISLPIGLSIGALLYLNDRITQRRSG